jgi:hypothetical protein
MSRGLRARARAVAALALAGLGVCGAARPAAAYVRYKTAMTGAAFAWPQSCVKISVYPRSMADVNGNMDLTNDEITTAASAAGAAWSAEQNPCSFLAISVAPSTAATPIARYDYKNSLIFRTASWCAPSDGPDMCSYDPAALAITSVFANKSTGQIRDADIEVNSKSFIWADLEINPSAAGRQDLQNALTHEMGHLIGLDHTCYITGPAPLDENGQPIPSCESASAAVRATTMFASAEPGDLQKRTLAPDDKQAICDIYPIAADPMTCTGSGGGGNGGEDSGGCQVAPLGGGGEGVLAVALAGLAAALRRRARGR